MSIPFYSSQNATQTHRTATFSIRITLSISRKIRKIARWLERLADRLETWARVRSIVTGDSGAFDTVVFIPIGPGQPMTVTRDARGKVISISIEKIGDDSRSVAGGVR